MGECNSRNGSKCQKQGFCVQAFCRTIDVSRNHIYRDRRCRCRAMTEGEVLESVMDTAGMAMRANRRSRDRKVFPNLYGLDGRIEYVQTIEPTHKPISKGI